MKLYDYQLERFGSTQSSFLVDIVKLKTV